MSFKSYFKKLKLRYPKKTIIKFFLIAFLPLVLFISINLFSRFSLKTSYNLHAITEGVTINILEIVENSGLVWNFNDARIISYAYQGDYQEKYFSGAIQFNDSIVINVKRIAKGKCIMQIESTINNSIGNLIINDEFEKKLDASLLLTVDSIQHKSNQGATMIFPLNGFNGFISTPRPIGEESDLTIPILRRGTISLFNTSFNENSIYKAGTLELYPGDQFKLQQRNNNYNGFLAINENPCMNLNYKVAGAKGFIEKPGGIQRPIESTLLSKFQHDSFYQWISLFFAILVIITSLISSISEIKQMFKQ